LETFYLNNNEILHLPDEIGSFVNLKQLFIHENKLQTLPETIKQLQQLEELSLFHNNLRHCCKSFSFSSSSSITECLLYLQELPKLNGIWLRQNEIRHLPSFHGNLAIKVLDVSSNCIDFIDPAFCTVFQHCTQIDFSQNRLQFLPQSFFFFFPSLKICNLNQNELKEVPSSLLKCDQLEEFNVAKNALISLPKELYLLSNLRKLNANSNQITQIPIDWWHFQKHLDHQKKRKLIELNLTKNPIQNTTILQVMILLFHANTGIFVQSASKLHSTPTPSGPSSSWTAAKNGCCFSMDDDEKWAMYLQKLIHCMREKKSQLEVNQTFLEEKCKKKKEIVTTQFITTNFTITQEIEEQKKKKWKGSTRQLVAFLEKLFLQTKEINLEDYTLSYKSFKKILQTFPMATSKSEIQFVANKFKKMEENLKKKVDLFAFLSAIEQAGKSKTRKGKVTGSFATGSSNTSSVFPFSSGVDYVGLILNQLAKFAHEKEQVKTKQELPQPIKAQLNTHQDIQNKDTKTFTQPEISASTKKTTGTTTNITKMTTTTTIATNSTTTSSSSLHNHTQVSNNILQSCSKEKPCTSTTTLEANLEKNSKKKKEKSAFKNKMRMHTKDTKQQKIMEKQRRRVEILEKQLKDQQILLVQHQHQATKWKNLNEQADAMMALEDDLSRRLCCFPSQEENENDFLLSEQQAVVVHQQETIRIKLIGKNHIKNVEMVQCFGKQAVFDVSLNLDTTVLQVKQQIEAFTQIPVDQQVSFLMFD
jgi:hypothetical protein